MPSSRGISIPVVGVIPAERGSYCASWLRPMTGEKSASRGKCEGGIFALQVRSKSTRWVAIIAGVLPSFAILPSADARPGSAPALRARVEGLVATLIAARLGADRGASPDGFPVRGRRSRRVTRWPLCFRPVAAPPTFTPVRFRVAGTPGLIGLVRTRWRRRARARRGRVRCRSRSAPRWSR